MDFEVQARDAAAKVINTLTAITPIFLVIVILGIAMFNGWLEYVYYLDVIGQLAFVPGIIFASIRFGSGLGGIHMFRNGEYFRGLFFIVISVGLTFWTSNHAPEMAKSIAAAPAMHSNAEWFIRTALWVSLLGELMIATYMSAKSSAATEAETAATQRTTTKKTATWHSGTNENPGATLQSTTETSRNGDTQHFGVNGAANPGATATAQPQRPIGFYRNEQPQQNVAAQPQQQQQQQDATGATSVSNGASSDDGVLVSEQLDKAKNNLRAYRSKLRNGNGNKETLRKGVNKWEARVAELEEKLQQIG